MANKKAQIEVSFNWIFVLVAGGLILLFFVMFIMNQRDASGAQVAQVLQSRLDTVFTVIQQTPDSIQTFEPLTFGLEFRCEEGIQSYSVVGSRTATFMDHHIMFSPNQVGGSSGARLVAWTKNFNAPYPVTPVLYFSDEQTQYVFVTDTPLVNELYNHMPDSFSKISVSLQDTVPDEGYRWYIIVVEAETGLPNPENLRNNYDVVTIDATRRLGLINGTVNGIAFVGEEMLWGAIITGDPTLFECSRERLLNRYIVANKIQMKRIEKVREAYETQGAGTDCEDIYSDSGDAMETLRRINTSIHVVLDDNNSNLLASSIASFSSLNELSDRRRCGWLY